MYDQFVVVPLPFYVTQIQLSGNQMTTVTNYLYELMICLRFRNTGRILYNLFFSITY